MEYSTLLQVPCTRNGRLAKAMIQQETNLARMSGYNVKIIEKPGTPLARLFQRIYTPETCHWNDCPACLNCPEGKRSKCRTSNIMYEATCLLCIKEAKDETRKEESVGKYIGEKIL